NEIWSVALDSVGEFTGLARLEITLPQISTNFPYSNPVSDLTFTPAGAMIVTERTMRDGNISVGHNSRVLEFSFSGNAWNLTNPMKYQTGCVQAQAGYPTNAAGGVDLDLTPNAAYSVWVTADWLHKVGATPPYGDFVSG